MHELGIVESWLQTARDAAAGRPVTAVHTRVGTLSGADPDALPWEYYNSNFFSPTFNLGVLKELRFRGVDISACEYIAAFSCAHTLHYFEKVPPFIDIKHQQLGIMTAKRLLDRMHSFNRLPRTDIVIAPELVVLD